MRSDHLTQIQADVLTFLHQNKGQTVFQVAHALNKRIEVIRPVILRLKCKGFIEFEYHRSEGGFNDGRKSFTMNAVGDPEAVFGMLVNGVLDKPRAPEHESTYHWMKRQFGKRRTVELLKAAGAWKPSPKTTAKAW